MTAKKILIVRNAAASDFGGGERFPVFLAMALKKAGYEPIIISRSSKLLDFAKHNSIPIHHGWWWSRQNWSGSKVLLTPIYFIWQLILYLYYLLIIVRKRPSVLHLQSKDDFIAGTFAAKTLGTRVAWTDHADLKHVWQNLGVWYKNPIGKLVYLAARRTDAITVVSHSEEKLVKQHLNKTSSVNSKITVVYNGVFDQKNEYEAPVDADIVRYIIVSRLVYDKGIREAISAFNKLKDEFVEVSLTIIGDGPDGADLRTMDGSENVQFLGYITNPLKYLGQSEIFVHPTYHEGFSVSLVEASMMSLPIIATSVGGNLEIIKDRKTGLLIPAQDSESLYQAMKELYENKKIRKEYGNNARRQYVQKFEFNRIVTEQFIPIYQGTKS